MNGHGIMKRDRHGDGHGDASPLKQHKTRPHDLRTDTRQRRGAMGLGCLFCQYARGIHARDSDHLQTHNKTRNQRSRINARESST